MEDDKDDGAISVSCTLLASVGKTTSLRSRKAETLADSLEAQLQPVKGPSDPAVIETVNQAMCAYDFFATSELKLTSPSEVLQAMKGLKFGKAVGPNGVPNRVLRHLSKRAITFLKKVLNAILYGLSFLTLVSFPVETLSSYLDLPTFQTFF
jgi:hypothetical protein